MKKSPSEYPPKTRNDPHILLWAWIVALLLCGSGALALYFNPEWRQSEFALVVEETDEEGIVKKKVKVERPEPNEDQVREIARNQERKKREELKREVKKLVEVVRETEEVKRQRKHELASETADDEAFRLAIEIEIAASQLRRSVLADPIMGDYDLPKRGSERTFEIATRLADEARADVDGVLSPDEARSQMTVTEELVDISGKLTDVIRRGRKNLRARAETKKEERRIRKELSDEIRFSDDLQDKSEAYLAFIRQLLDERLAASDLPEPPDLEPEQLAEIGSEMLAEYDDAALDQMSAHELYETAQELGEQVNENFTEARAAELAAAQSQSFEEALNDLYQPGMPETPDLSGVIGPEAPPPSNSEEFTAFNAALEQAARAAQNLAQTAQSRASQLSGLNAEQGQTMSGQQLSQMLREQSTVRSAMASMASTQGQPKGAMADMTSLMAQSYQMGSGSESNAFGDEGPMNAWLNRQAYEGSLGVDTNTQGRVLKDIHTRQIVAQALPGRKFTDESQRKGWLFIDTWYVIGPWERPKDASFTKKFPPETLVDFDAEYPGKLHPRTKEPLQLEWRFVQTDRIRINPPDEITGSTYYAYTEVHSDRPREVLLAVGTDDYGKIWINDLVVWEENGLSPWSLDQGFRKILLKEGYNKILLRLESGPGVAFFSLMLCPINLNT